MKKADQSKMQDRGIRQGWRKPLAWGAAAVSIVLTTVALVLPATTLSRDDDTEIIQEEASAGDSSAIFGKQSLIFQDGDPSAEESGESWLIEDMDDETETDKAIAGDGQKGGLPYLFGTGEETETETETEPETETGTEAETGTGHETESETEAETASGTETEMTSEPGTEPGPETEVTSESETEPGSETMATESESETESEDQTETESESESEDQTETESETEPGQPRTVEMPVEGTDGQISLSLTYMSDALPEGSSFHASIINADDTRYDTFEEKALASVDSVNKEMTALFEIVITDADGHAVEPVSPVTVQVKMGTEPSAEKTYYAVHFREMRVPDASAGFSARRAPAAGETGASAAVEDGAATEIGAPAADEIGVSAAAEEASATSEDGASAAVGEGTSSAEVSGTPTGGVNTASTEVIPMTVQDNQLTFTAESFSAYAIVVTRGDTRVAAANGETVTIEGSSANYHAWEISCSPEGCAALDHTDQQTVTLTAAAEGTATLTHRYGKNQKKLSTETYVVAISAAPAGTGGGSQGGGTAAVPEQGSILTRDMIGNTANEWQVVDQGYAGNAPEYKTVSGTDSYQAVRVQKNVIPTGTENEFYVYLSIDTKLLINEYLRYAQYQATTSNNYHGDALGSFVKSMTGDEKVEVSGNSSSGYPNSGYFTIKDHKGNTIAENVQLWWSQAENVTFYLKTSSGYVLMGVKVKNTDSNVVQLSEAAEQAVYKDAMNLISLQSVTDTMGDHIEYLGAVKGDYSAEPTFNSNTGTLTWTPVMKSNPPQQTTKSGNEITTWNLNVAELIYKVRLNVQKEGFQSCAANMSSTVSDKESYPVNDSAVLSYETKVGTQTGSGTATFQKPYVRGLLYDYQIKKVDEDGSPLPGAEFSFSGSGNGAAGHDGTGSRGTVVYQLTGTSGEDGMVSWKHAADSSKSEGTAAQSPGVAWGTYTVRETKAPDGYHLDANSEYKTGKQVILCYTMNSGSLTPSGTHMAYSESNQTYATVTNTLNKAHIKVVKYGAGENDQSEMTALAGAVFDFTLDGARQTPITTATNGLIYESDVDGTHTYQVEETSAPAGYEKAAPFVIHVGYDDSQNKVTVTVSGPSGTDTGDGTAAPGGSGSAEGAGANLPQVTYDAASDTYVLTVTDQKIRKLPVKIVKADMAVNGTLLAGAVFSVTKDGVSAPVEGSPWTSGSGGESGKELGVIYSGYLETGSYTLTETKAPDGYNLMKDSATITITSTEVTYTQTDHRGGAPVSAEPENSAREVSEDNPYVVYIYNNPGVELPETGGPGPLPYTLSGIAYIVMAALMYGFRMRRRERRSHNSL